MVPDKYLYANFQKAPFLPYNCMQNDRFLEKKTVIYVITDAVRASPS